MPCHNCVKHRDLIKHLYHDSQKDEEDLKILRNGFMISTARLATIGYLHRLERAASVAIIFSIVPNTGRSTLVYRGTATRWDEPGITNSGPANGKML